MDKDFDEIERRLSKADPKAPELDEILLQEATRSKRKALPNPKVAQFAVASVAGILGLSLFATSLPSANDPLIRLADSGSGGAQSNMATESSVAEDSLAVDSLPGWINPFEYKAAEGLSEQAGSGAVYELLIEGNPTQRLNEFAAIFNQRGSVELEQWSTEYFPSYKLETDEAYFSLYWHGSGIINYSSKRNWLREECYLTDEDLLEEEIRPGPGCEPLPTVPMPSEKVLVDEAFQAITAAGYKGTENDITVERYEWGASAFATTRVDGIETAIEWYVSWDQTGQIANVSGHLAEAVKVGDFNTVSPVEAVSRISDGYWFGAAARSFYDYSIQDSIALEDQIEISVEDPEMEIMPVEPFPGEMESMELTITDSTSATLLIEDSEGKGWLVPGYLLETDQGWFESVVALEEGVIEPPRR